MSTVLLPLLPFAERETFTSFVRRLALFHTGQAAHRLLADQGIDPREVNRGTKAALGAIAEISGADVKSLEAAAIGRIDRCRIFRGDRWTREFVRPEGARVCPECLTDDMLGQGLVGQKIRMHWRLRPVSTCPIHLRRLAELNEIDGRDDLEAPFFSANDLKTLAGQHISQEPTTVEKWIFDRLEGAATTGGDWLDAQTIEQGVRVCEMLGTVLKHGIHVNLKEISEEEWRLNAVAGFEVARKGESHIVAALDEIRASSTSMAGQAGPKAKYGRLYEWLAYTSPVVSHGPIVDLLRGHILNHTAIEPGEIVLGERITERRCHSVYSLSIVLKLHPKRLRKVLEMRGSIPPGCSGVALNLLVFPAAETEAFCQDFLNSVSLAALPLMIQGSRTQATSLHRTGVLKAVINRDLEEGIGRIDFSQGEVAQFLARIEALEMARKEIETVDLTLATKRTGFSTGQIMEAIFGGHLLAFRSPGDIGLSVVRISAESLSYMREKSRVSA